MPIFTVTAPTLVLTIYTVLGTVVISKITVAELLPSDPVGGSLMTIPLFVTFVPFTSIVNIANVLAVIA